MTWVTWRQQRLEALLGGAVLALIALFLLKTGLDLAAAFRSTGLAACLAQSTPAPTCPLSLDAFRQRAIPFEYPLYQGLIFLPLLIGLLLGAPFVLELEQGTYRLAWTQSITRTRWVLVKVGLLVGAAALAGAALAAVTTWWWGPINRIDTRLDRNPFELIGVVPVAYTIFAVALCLAAGTLLRRTIPAVGATLVGFMALRIWIQTNLRYNYLPPFTKTFPVGTPYGLAQFGLQQVDYIVSLKGTVPPAVVMACMQANPGVPPDRPPVQACLAQHGAMQLLVYQTADRFWPFQGIESAIFLGLAAALLALTVWWVRRRVA
ncbi:MAG TPA: hypothetical protein VFL91_01400 [Thermomicrobiales bacterium]|nr:hypothetical protein [Thermomicrobiales bacterium]